MFFGEFSHQIDDKNRIDLKLIATESKSEAKNEEKVRITIGNSFYVLIAASLVVSLFGIFFSPFIMTLLQWVLQEWANVSVTTFQIMI